MKIFLSHILRYIYHLLPSKHMVLNGKIYSYFEGIIQFWVDCFKYNSKCSKEFPLKLKNLMPIYFDRFDPAGNIVKHYTYQDIWAARKVFESKVKKHYDIGSRFDGFITHCLVFTKVEMLDIRPFPYAFDGLGFIKTDATNLANIKDSSISSLSCLHVVEHFGLGRYGDVVDDKAYLKAIKEMKRVVAKGGQLLFSTPIGKQRVEFNAHRIFDPEYALELFCKGDHALVLKEFSVVKENHMFLSKVSPANFKTDNFSCGLYHFVKPK